MDYKKTIITPKTSFPMKAGLPNREPGMLERWESQRLYEELLKKNRDAPGSILHDGPPFSNGDIHMGHALNKTLKDFIVRSKGHAGLLHAPIRRAGTIMACPSSRPSSRK